MNNLSVETLSKSYNDKLLFENLNFGVGAGQKVALVGINGCGKSTLLKIIAGVETPETGVVAFRKGIKISYLSQNPVFKEDQSISDALFEGESSALQAIRNYELALKKAEINPDAHDELQSAMEEMDAQNAWDYESQVTQILGRLGLHDLEQIVGELSGGQRKRIALAKTLIEKPDFLIMDEPTNHLDLESIEWLENYLATAQMSLLLVTHDRYFLEKVTNEIFEIQNGNLYTYKGSYSYYLEKKAERQEVENVEIGKAKNLMKKELEWIRRQPKARGTKAKYRVEAFEGIKEKASKNTTEQQAQISTVGRRQGGKILELSKISKSYGENCFIDSFSYIFKKNDRIGIIGPNGVGKSTFLNTITGAELADKGELDKGVNTVFGYYHQNGPKFNPEMRIIDVVKEVAEVIEMADKSQITASQLLNLFNFPPKTQYSVVGKLSGGEKRRLQLLRVLMKNPNFLILDEPTNDLDLVTLNVLEDFLFNFKGCLLLVSHDRYFMDRLIDHAFVFRGNGLIEDFGGNYSDFREKEKEEEREKASTKTKDSKKETSQKKETTPKEKRKLSYKEQKEYETLEQEIEKLETQKEKIIQKLNAGSGEYEEINQWSSDIKKIDDTLENKTMRWMELAEFL